MAASDLPTVQNLIALAVYVRELRYGGHLDGLTDAQVDILDDFFDALEIGGVSFD